MLAYKSLVQHVLDHGTRKENRTGDDTLSTFNYNYEHDLADGFPLLTTKSVSWKNIVIEMLWFLSGQTDITFLHRHGCKFWNAWADSDGLVPSAYGNFWRQFPVVLKNPDGSPKDRGQWIDYNDQIAWVLGELRSNPMSRRMVVSAWAPGNAQTSKLPPCHAMFVLNVQNSPGILWHSPPPGAPVRREDSPIPILTPRLCLHLTQRSCDVALGVPYNIASYALLLHLFCRMSNTNSGGTLSLEPGIFAHTLIDAHVYTSKQDGSMAEHDHVPGLVQQISRECKPLPRLWLHPAIRGLEDLEHYMDPSMPTEMIMRDFRLDGYEPHPAIAFKVAV